MPATFLTGTSHCVFTGGSSGAHPEFSLETGRPWTIYYLCLILKLCMGRDSSVGTATRYGLDGRGNDSWWGGRDFPHPSRPSLGLTQGTGSLPGGKRPGRGVEHPPTSSAGLKERVELYLYSPSGPSWPVLGWNLLFFKVCYKNHVMNTNVT